MHPFLCPFSPPCWSKWELIQAKHDWQKQILLAWMGCHILPSPQPQEQKGWQSWGRFNSSERNACVYAEHAAEGCSSCPSVVAVYLLHIDWVLWRQQLTLIREIPNVPGFICPAICPQIRPINWCGRTNTKISAPFAASATSGTATWDKSDKQNEPQESSVLARHHHTKARADAMQMFFILTGPVA